MNILMPIRAAALACALSSPLVVADELHAGDIIPFLAGGTIGLNATLFEADFGDLPGGLFRTDDPGYDVDVLHDGVPSGFTPGNWLQIEGLSALRFWNGSIWTTPNANETVHIVGALDDPSTLADDTVFAAGGVTNPFSVIGEVLSDGGLHEHLDMQVRTAGVLGGSVGAFWVTFRLVETAPFSTSALHVSDPINIVFNRGLYIEDFELAVSAVPVPGAIYLLGSALGALALRRRAG